MVSDEIFKLNEFEIEVVKSMICAEHKLGVEHKLGDERFGAKRTSSPIGSPDSFHRLICTLCLEIIFTCTKLKSP